MDASTQTECLVNGPTERKGGQLENYRNGTGLHCPGAVGQSLRTSDAKRGSAHEGPAPSLSEQLIWRSIVQNADVAPTSFAHCPNDSVSLSKRTVGVSPSRLLVARLVVPEGANR